MLNTNKKHIKVSDERVQRVIDSWRGVRPTMHFSTSREDVLANHCADTLPCRDTLLSEGMKKAKLRAHSNFFWNRAVNQWVQTFTDQFDIMCEAKAKNLASFELYKQWNPNV